MLFHEIFIMWQIVIVYTVLYFSPLNSLQIYKMYQFYWLPKQHGYQMITSQHTTIYLKYSSNAEKTKASKSNKRLECVNILSTKK